MKNIEHLLTRKKITSAGCWEYTGPRNKKGYGHAGYIGLIHRLSYEYYVGEIPEGMLVCHQCDNPPCFNPAHLFVGTESDNAMDSARKLRHHIGEKNPKAKLTDKKVVEIINLGKEKEVVWLAKKYGVDRDTIDSILSGRTWKHIKRG